VGGHVQTLAGFWTRRRLRWRRPSEDWVVEAEAGVRLLARASWQPGRREVRPALLIVHGLGGSDRSGYVIATGELAWRQGWHVLRMNMRGAGDSSVICPRLYNAGLDSDLLSVVEAACRCVPRVAVAGFSLGASLALLALGRRPDRIPEGLRAAGAISPPLDLEACTTALERWGNWPYQRYFMRSLRADYRQLQTLAPDTYAAGRERGLRTVREYDDHITAHYGGYTGAAEYYERSSAGPHLSAITRPTLILAAEDDPMIPQESVSRWHLPRSGIVERELHRTGGHVGFVGASHAPARFWAAERVLDFLGRFAFSEASPAGSPAGPPGSSASGE
jgi:predicted alpha/beta-fold hydrolase